MKTSTFLHTLRGHADLPVVFRLDRATLAPGYHLTEVKRVAYETMDCGAKPHRWSENQFEIWVPPLAALQPGRTLMLAAKFLDIVSRVEAGLPLDHEAPARIHTSLGKGPAALHDIATVTAREGRLWVDLTPDRTKCKAAERRVGAIPGGGCGAGGERREAAACCS